LTTKIDNKTQTVA